MCVPSPRWEPAPAEGRKNPVPEFEADSAVYVRLGLMRTSP